MGVGVRMFCGGWERVKRPSWLEKQAHCTGVTFAAKRWPREATLECPSKERSRVFCECPLQISKWL